MQNHINVSGAKEYVVCFNSEFLNIEEIEPTQEIITGLDSLVVYSDPKSIPPLYASRMSGQQLADIAKMAYVALSDKQSYIASLLAAGTITQAQADSANIILIN